MASALTDNAKDVALDAIAAVAIYASCHTAAPGTTGVNEVTGGTPTYARKGVTWAAASGGSVAMNGTLPVFNIPPGTTVAYIGLWSALTVGTFYGYFDNTDEVFAGQGTLTISSGSWSL